MKNFEKIIKNLNETIRLNEEKLYVYEELLKKAKIRQEEKAKELFDYINSKKLYYDQYLLFKKKEYSFVGLIYKNIKEYENKIANLKYYINNRKKEKLNLEIEEKLEKIILDKNVVLEIENALDTVIEDNNLYSIFSILKKKLSRE